jgi:hypothetical protein
MLWKERNDWVFNNSMH